MFRVSFLLVPALFISLAVVLVLPAQAQVSVSATPYSFRAALSGEVAAYTVPATGFRAETAQDIDANGFFNVPSAQDRAEVAVDLGFDNAGTWRDLPDGGRLWQLRLTAPDASWLSLVYDDFWMPPGASFFLYNDDRSVVRGAFTEQNNKRHRGFATGEVPGETTILEYYEPSGSAPGRLHVTGVVQGTQGDVGGPLGVNGPYTPIALPCSINAACPVGSGWENEAQAVVKFNGCTGVLVNNTDQDETPYVLTANHCGNPAVGDTLNWVFQFNYQSDTCADPSQTPSYQTISGAVVRAAGSGSSYYDFTLLELLEPIPASYNAYFAGWSIDTATPASGVVIGHPRGDIKKISLDNDPLTTFSTTYWRAIFDQGTIEIGSSGSPLFDENHQVVGLLKSSRALDPNACSGPGGDDNGADILFPKLYYLWNIGNAGERLSDFLDPSGTGSTSVPPLPGSGSGAPSDIWINEINADSHSGGSPEDEEFIEIVGPPGANLGNYTLQVYTCAGGSATLQSTQTLNSITLQNDYQAFGVCVIGGPGLDSGVRDQTFAGGGADVLPDGAGLVVLKDAAGNELFDYQYDTETGGTPDNCPPSRATRSGGDAPGNGTMGFTFANPSSEDPGFSGLVASPGLENSDGGQALPVELVAFAAVLDGSAVELRWQTASETNNAGFEIQMRNANFEIRDSQWEALGFVDGHGTTLEPQAYRQRIAYLPAGRHRFRLKQLDYDGAFEYSPEVEVAIALPTAFHLTTPYPNPFNPETSFSVSVAQAQQVQVAVYDVTGRRVALLHDGFIDASTTHAFTFEAQGLPSGLYLIRAAGERFIASQKVTLLK